MTRLDTPAPTTDPVGRKELKEVIRRELFFEVFRRKILGCAGYLLVVIIIISIPSIYIAASAAKSGFVNVPLLSSWLYKPSVPTRVVRPYVGTTAEDVMASVGRHAKYDIHTGLVTVIISETELTTIVAETAKNGGSKGFPLQDAQVVIEPRMVELFAVSPQDKRDTTVLARFTPSVSGGKIGLEVRELFVGNYGVPTSIAQLGASYLTSIVASKLSNDLSSVGTLLNIEADIGELRVTMTPRQNTKK